MCDRERQMNISRFWHWTQAQQPHLHNTTTTKWKNGRRGEWESNISSSFVCCTLQRRRTQLRAQEQQQQQRLAAKKGQITKLAQLTTTTTTACSALQKNMSPIAFLKKMKQASYVLSQQQQRNTEINTTKQIK